VSAKCQYPRQPSVRMWLPESLNEHVGERGRDCLAFEKCSTRSATKETPMPFGLHTVLLQTGRATLGSPTQFRIGHL